ncbi:MAG: TolC family protein [Phycisphaerales bacterium]|nr:TolC family protein [Phycisphaerales bacterium]MCB9855420.1 TolC family protein [Phycisphaerales bacterium]
MILTSAPERGLSRRGLLGILCAASLTIAACAKVEPQRDFQSTADRIKDRLAVDDVFDPAAEALVEQRVRSMLVGGLTVDEAVNVALLKNRSFQALFQAIGVSRADVVQSGLLTNPSIGLTARFPEGGGRANISFSLGQQIADLWQIPVRRQIAEARLEETISDVVRQAVELAADVRKKYYELATIRKRESIGRENLRLVQQSVEVAEKRMRGGESGAIDVNLLRAAAVGVQANLLTLSRDADVAKADLAKAMGMARWEELWEISASLDAVAPPIPDDQTLLVSAMRQRLESRIAEYKVRAAEGELKRQQRSVFSSVQLGLEGERLESRALPGRKIAADTLRSTIRQGQLTAPDIQSRGERNIDRAQVIDLLLGPSIQITLPIWDQNQAQIAKASYELEASRKDYEAVLDEIANQVQQAAAVVRASAALMAFYEQAALPTADANLALARKAYEGGEQNVLAVINAQEFLMVQRQMAVQIRRDYLVASAELNRALGGRYPPPCVDQASKDARVLENITEKRDK